MKKVVQQKNQQRDLLVFTSKQGSVIFRSDFENQTIWATQAQIAQAFSVDVRTINEHLKNIYKTKELNKTATIRNFRIVQKEGAREISREVLHYNLDAIISVGYRVNSKVATSFRQWATKTLRQHIVDGFTINPERVRKNHAAFMAAVDAVSAVLPAPEAVGSKDVLALVKLFADTWFSLDAYDKEAFAPKKVTKKKVTLTSDDLMASIAVLKEELIKKGEATEHFAQVRSQQSLEGIVGNVMQSFGGVALYPTIESKAAHLLYFIIKNHPFVDGNKRSGAYAFVWFLARAKVLDTKALTPTALTALTLLIAESAPSEKEKVVGLVTLLIAKR